jgi:tyrocidine synthetase-3
MGMFVNTLALRNFPNGQKTFIQFLEELKENTLKAFENQDYLYENLVEKAAVDRDTGRNPLFDTMFALQNFDALKIEIPGLKVQPLDYEIWISKFDLTLTTVETGENLLFIFEYCTKLFKQETIDRFISYFINTISTVLKCRDIKISEIEIIGEKEKNRILYEFNDTAVDYPKYKTIYHLFEEQVERTADHTALVGTKLKNTKYTFNTNPISENTGYNKGDALRAGFEVFGEIQLSYSLLNEESNHLSYALLERGVHHDNIVGIIIERSVEMIIGILGILKAGGAYLPIDLDYPQERINYILKDSGAKVLVTTGNLTKESEKTKWWEGNRNLEVVFFNTLYLPIPRNSHLPNSLTSQPLNFSLLPSTSLAYMIYTSGSTGQPKGVMIQHENLVNAAYGWLEEYKLSIIEVNLLQMAGYSFDVSCGDLCRALISGGKLIICPEDAKFNFYLLYYYLCLHRVTLFESTPSLVIPFMDYIHENRLRLKYMQLLIVGSDSFRFKDYQTIQSRYGKSMRIINSYGATEATIDSTYYESDYGDGELTISEFVPIGKPMPNIKCFIFDAYCRIKPIGVSGEIVITGSGIARGYANRPELTSERFIYFSHYSHITNQYLPEGYLLSIDENRKTKAKLYKTGDIGRWLSDANIECLGRIDHQIKIRGFRVELGEIEHRLLTYEKIKEAIVIAREDNNDKYLCAYLVTRSNVATPIDPSDLEDYLSNHMPDYMVPSYFIQLDHIPLTPNGKIDRKALPAPVLKLGDNYEAPRDGIEKKLVEIWSGVLGIEKEKIGISDNFFHLGGHSLKATLLISRIHKELKVNVPLPEIFKTPYIRGLAAFIKNSETQRFFSIVAVEKKEYYSLSSAQKRLFVLHRMDEKGIAYNMPSVWQLEGNLDIEKFAAVFHRLILRHESMRSSFYMVKDEPVQRIHDDVVFEIEYYDFPTDYTDKNYKLQNTNYKPIAIPNHKIQITNKTVPFGQILDASGGGDEEPAARDSQPAAALISSFIRPFDLSKAPLLRVGLLDSAGGGTGTENRHGHIFLMIDMHHIISDGVSMDILARDFTALYGNEVLPPLQIQYKDFSQWQNSEKKKNNIKQQETYWLKEFAGEIPLLNLPTDYVRSDLLDFAGSSLSFQIDNTLTAEIKKQASYMNVSIMMFLLSVYKILLSKFALKNDIIVGTVIAGRQHADLEPVIGFFVNMLAIRTRPNQIKSFSDYLAQIKEKTLKAYDNQGYQFEELVDKLEIPRHRNRHPLVDVVFVFNGEPQRTIKSGELAGNSINLDPRKVSHFDLMLHATDYGDSVSMIFEYSTALFKAKTIDRLSRLYLDILEQVLENGNIKLEEITSGHEFVTVKSNVLQDSQHDFDF